MEPRRVPGVARVHTLLGMAGSHPMEPGTLKALYVEGIRDLYSAENQILYALPKMHNAATNDELRRAFAAHLDQTETHVARLEHICRRLVVSPNGKHCNGMEGLIADGTQLIRQDADPDVLDAGLISLAQHMEHYELAGYGTVRTYAQLLGFDEQAAMLQTTLLEERDTDQSLTEVALIVNLDAIAGAAGYVEMNGRHEWQSTLHAVG